MFCQYFILVLFSGHAYAGGAFLALAHDFRVMVKDHGWFCINEVRLNLMLPAGFSKLVSRRLSSPKHLDELVLFGKKFTGQQALECGLIHHISSSDNLLNDSIKMVETCIDSQPFNRLTLQNFKMDLYKDVFETLISDTEFKHLQMTSSGSKL